MDCTLAWLIIQLLDVLMHSVVFRIAEHIISNGIYVFLTHLGGFAFEIHPNGWIFISGEIAVQAIHP